MDSTKTNGKVEVGSKPIQGVSDKVASSAADSVQAKANSNSTLKKIRHLVSASKLIEAGAHIGLNPRKWNPKMKQFIYAKRSNNHIIDILKSLVYLNNAYNLLGDTAKEGGRVLIVGTTGKLAKDLIKEEAQRGKCHYITQRWLGGTLTNFKNIQSSIRKLNNLLTLEKSGEIDVYTKKEQIAIRKEIEKLSKFYGGIRSMRKLPSALIVLDPVGDQNAILEARKLNIPVIALANTNSNPDLIDYIIPVNNHSIRSITLILGVLIDAIAEVASEPLKIVGKNDDQIILPESNRKPKEAVINHKKSSR